MAIHPSIFNDESILLPENRWISLYPVCFIVYWNSLLLYNKAGTVLLKNGGGTEKQFVCYSKYSVETNVLFMRHTGYSNLKVSVFFFYALLFKSPKVKFQNRICWLFKIIFSLVRRCWKSFVFGDSKIPPDFFFFSMLKVDFIFKTQTPEIKRLLIQ